MFLKISQNSQKTPLVCEIFKNTFFCRTPLEDCFWLFRRMLLKWDTASSVWKTSDEYSLSRNTNLRSTIQVYHFFFQQDKLSVYVFVGLQFLLPEAAIRVEVFCKKRYFKDFVNFVGKKPVLESLFNKVSGLAPILKNICQRLLLHCTRTAPLTITYPFYFIFSTFLIITATTVNISDVCFSFKFKRLQRI